MDRSRGASVNALLLLMVLLLAAPSLCVPNKCSACQAVAGEIELGLANERPRNHLDLRHRLDSKGQREGKVIDYNLQHNFFIEVYFPKILLPKIRVSELRVVELLEGLCSKFTSYTLRKEDTGKGEWIKVDFGSLSDIDRQQADSHSKQLVSYCGRLLETTEDEVMSKIQKGEVKAGDVEVVLCVELTKDCKPLKNEDEKWEERVSTHLTGGRDGEL